jgi:hypothetical protein
MTYPDFDDDYTWVSEHVSAISIQIYRSIDCNKFLEQLPQCKRVVFYVGRAVTRIFNGGLDSYLRGDTSDEVNNLVDSLKIIGSKDFLVSMESAKIALGFPDTPTNHSLTNEELDELCKMHGVDSLDEIIPIHIDLNIWHLIRQYCEPLVEK